MTAWHRIILIKCLPLVGTFVLIFGIASQGFVAKAQHLTITYDFVKDQHQCFLRKGNGSAKAIRNATVGHNQDITVELRNVNENAIRVEFEVEYNSDFTGSGYSGGEGTGEGSVFSMFSAVSALSGLPGVGELIGGGFGFGDTLDLDPDEEDLLDETVQLRNRLSKEVKRYNDLVTDWQVLEHSLWQLERLSLNTRLSKDSLQGMAAGIIESIGLESKPMGFSEYAMKLSQDFSNRREALAQANRAYRSNMTSLQRSPHAMLAYTSHINSSAEDDFAQIDGVLGEMGKGQPTNHQIKRLVYRLANVVESLQQATFRESATFLAAGDFNSITVTFYRKAVDSTGTPERLIRRRVFTARSKDLLRMVPGFGIALPDFGSQDMSFFVRDDQIRSSVNEGFVPNITTMMHIFPDIGLVSPLGTFGVGVPLRSNGAFSLNFFLGAGIAVGKQNRVFLSGGLTAGTVSVLDQGLAVGDSLTNFEFVELPTKQVYRKGGFFSLSLMMP